MSKLQELLDEAISLEDHDEISLRNYKLESIIAVAVKALEYVSDNLSDGDSTAPDALKRIEEIAGKR